MLFRDLSCLLFPSPPMKSAYCFLFCTDIETNSEKSWRGPKSPSQLELGDWFQAYALSDLSRQRVVSGQSVISHPWRWRLKIGQGSHCWPWAGWGQGSSGWPFAGWGLPLGVEKPRDTRAVREGRGSSERASSFDGNVLIEKTQNIYFNCLQNLCLETINNSNQIMIKQQLM